MSFKIKGTGSAVPARAVSNNELAEYVDTSDEWISQRTGIRSRYISQGETATSLAVEASKKALEAAGISGSELDLIIVGTVSADTYYPSAACTVQAQIGAEGCVAFDVNAACSGFLYAMQIADGFFAAGHATRALIIGTEILSKMTDWSDRSTCVLFGDGAGAAVLEKCPDSEGRVFFSSGADGSKGDALLCMHRPLNNIFVKNDPALDYTHMDGQEVFRFAVRTVPASITIALEKAGTALEDVDIFLLHQANIRIIEAAAKRLGAPLEKFPVIMQDYGNTSAASVPILLDTQVRNGNLKRGMKAVLSGFGGGLTWSSAVLDF